MSFWTLLVLILAVVLLAGRDKIRSFIERFDAVNRRKTMELAKAYQDPNAHFHLTIEEIDAGVEPVEQIWSRDPNSGTLSARFLWNKTAYDTAEEANEARRRHVLEKAKSFYMEIDDLSRRAIPRPRPCHKRRS